MIGAAAAALPVAVCSAAAGTLTSDWAASHESRARLVAGKLSGAAPGAAPLAGLEIELSPGWKTYWRNPGDAGGVPPAFDWTGSENVKPVVLYPAPHRLVDRSGENIGYKGGVTLPVTLEIADPKQPAKLRLHLEYGVCREICIPSEANLALDIPPAVAVADAAPLGLGDALARVPRRAAAQGAPAPTLVASKAMLAGEKPRITFDVAYPAATDGADAFAEGPGGAYVPMPRRVAATGNTVTYEIDLTGIDLADIKGKELTLTLVSDAGASEVSLPVR